MKYLGINLTKEVKEMHAENHKTLIKETEEDLKKCNNIPCSWTRRIKFKNTHTTQRNLHI